MKIGYKAFNSKLQCRGFQFKVGKTYEIAGLLKICSNGFHYCEQLKDTFNYYERSYHTRICKVEILGDTQSEEDKSCTSKIKILKELTKDEIKNLTDDLKFNSGDRNSGSYNLGEYNSGDRNSGSYNSGHCNSGDYNSGSYNSGNYNSGHRNSGHGNSGSYNSGRRNSGDHNSGDHNSGFFNSNTPTVRLFNKDSGLIFNSDIISKLKNINIRPKLRWVYENSMSDQEKLDNPSFSIIGGYLKNTGRIDYSRLTDEDKELIKSLPNFDNEIFKQITGISLL